MDTRQNCSINVRNYEIMKVLPYLLPFPLLNRQTLWGYEENNENVNNGIKMHLLWTLDKAYKFTL